MTKKISIVENLLGLRLLLTSQSIHKFVRRLGPESARKMDAFIGYEGLNSYATDLGLWNGSHTKSRRDSVICG